jgi:outer membrane protein assembly factor BamB
MGNGNIQAYNLDTGAPLWQKDLSGATSSNAQPVVANGLVYFVAFDGYLQARDAHTGVLVWHSTVLSSTLYPPLVTSSMVYATFPKDTTHGTLTALDAHTGAVKWQRAVLRGDYTPILWNGMLWLTENFNGPTVTFNAFDPTTGQPGQVVTFNNLPFTGEAQQIVNGLAFLNCNSSNSFCGVDLTSGKVLWQISDGYSFYDPWYANGTVYLHTKQGLFAVNPTTGQQVFAYKIANSGGVNLENRVPLVANNAVYFTVNGDYIAVNATTGKLLWTSHNPADYYAQGTYFDGKIVSPGSSVTALNANDGILAWHLPSQPGYPSLVGLGSW